MLRGKMVGTIINYVTTHRIGEGLWSLSQWNVTHVKDGSARKSPEDRTREGKAIGVWSCWCLANFQELFRTFQMKSDVIWHGKRDDSLSSTRFSLWCWDSSDFPLEITFDIHINTSSITWNIFVSVNICVTELRAYMYMRRRTISQRRKKSSKRVWFESGAWTKVKSFFTSQLKST